MTLKFEIKCIKENIEIKEKMGKDATFEKKLLKSYQKYSEEDYKHRTVINCIPLSSPVIRI